MEHSLILMSPTAPGCLVLDYLDTLSEGRRGLDSDTTDGPSLNRVVYRVTTSSVLHAT